MITSSGRLKQQLAQIKSQEQIKDQEPLTLAFDDNLETGFQLATFQGPLCAEPVEGMAYFVEDLTLDREGIEQEQGVCAQFGTVVRTSWDRCRRRNRILLVPRCLGYVELGGTLVATVNSAMLNENVLD